jgi:hypothetical protein
VIVEEKEYVAVAKANRARFAWLVRSIASSRDRGDHSLANRGPRCFGLFLTLSATGIMADTIQVTAPADFHVHLRQPPFSALVTPHVRLGGFSLAYVMVCIFPFRTQIAHQCALT